MIEISKHELKMLLLAAAKTERRTRLECMIDGMDMKSGLDALASIIEKYALIVMPGLAEYGGRKDRG